MFAVKMSSYYLENVCIINIAETESKKKQATNIASSCARDAYFSEIVKVVEGVAAEFGYQTPLSAEDANKVINTKLSNDEKFWAGAHAVAQETYNKVFADLMKRYGY